MIIYPGIRLEAILGATISTRQPHVHVDYIDYGATGVPAYPNSTTVPMTGVTSVIILNTPMSGQTKAREITELAIYNDDTGNVSVGVRTSDGTTARLYVSTLVMSTDTLVYQKMGGWQMLT